MKKNNSLNYPKLKKLQENKKKFFVGVPRHKRRQGSQDRFRGLWQRLGKDGRERVVRIAGLKPLTVYNKKPYNYWGTLKISYPSLMRRNFDKEMVNLKRYLRRKKVMKMRSMKAG